LCSTIGNPGSTGYLIISYQLLGLCSDYDTTPIVFCVRLWSQLLGLCGYPGSALGVLDRGIEHARYPCKTHALYWQAVTKLIILFDM